MSLSYWGDSHVSGQIGLWVVESTGPVETEITPISFPGGLLFLNQIEPLNSTVSSRIKTARWSFVSQLGTSQKSGQADQTRHTTGVRVTRNSVILANLLLNLPLLPKFGRLPPLGEPVKNPRYLQAGGDHPAVAFWRPLPSSLPLSLSK